MIKREEIEKRSWEVDEEERNAEQREEMLVFVDESPYMVMGRILSTDTAPFRYQCKQKAGINQATNGRHHV